MSFKSIKKALLRRKHIDGDNKTKLERCLTTFDLTALGIGSTLGLGIYVLAGKVASDKAGPAVCVSFFFAAVASIFAGICYAEFGARVSKAGSAYTYSYVTVGEFLAFIIGWNLVLEYVIGTASVARGYSEYIDALLNQTIQRHTNEWIPIKSDYLSAYPDLLAFSITLALTVMLAIGVKESTRFNSVFTGVNLLVVLFVIIYGAMKIDFHNWNLSKDEVPKGRGDGGFAPFGISGIMRGAATCFYGFIGFDIVATTGEEAKNPQKSIPISIVASLLLIFLAYFGVSSIQTLMVPYYEQSKQAPLPFVFERVGLPTAKIIISVGAIAGLTTSLLGGLYPLPRILYAMANDGLIFKFLADVNPRFKTPLKATVISGLFAGLMAALFNIDADMMSIGTLLAYTLVSVSVLILRFSKDAASNLNDTQMENVDLLMIERRELNNNTNCEKPLKQEQPPEPKEELEFNFQNTFKQILNQNGYQMPSKFSSIFSVYLIIVICFIMILLDIILAKYLVELLDGDCKLIFLVIIISSILLFLTFSLNAQPRNSKPVSFQVPFVPFVPLFSILINIYLMLNLSSITWIRFGVWLSFGLGIYLFYGIYNSNERFRNKQQLPIINNDQSTK